MAHFPEPGQGLGRGHAPLVATQSDAWSVVPDSDSDEVIGQSQHSSAILPDSQEDSHSCGSDDDVSLGTQHLTSAFMASQTMCGGLHLASVLGSSPSGQPSPAGSGRSFVSPTKSGRGSGASQQSLGENFDGSRPNSAEGSPPASGAGSSAGAAPRLPLYLRRFTTLPARRRGQTSRRHRVALFAEDSVDSTVRGRLRRRRRAALPVPFRRGVGQPVLPANAAPAIAAGPAVLSCVEVATGTPAAVAKSRGSRRRRVSLFTSSRIAAWDATAVQAWRGRRREVNHYLYRFTSACAAAWCCLALVSVFTLVCVAVSWCSVPDVVSKVGPFSRDEHSVFRRQLRRFHRNGWHVQGNWGLFSLCLPSRTGTVVSVWAVNIPPPHLLLMQGCNASPTTWDALSAAD